MLLDSRILLWLLSDSDRLGERSRAAISSATFVHVSAATVCELIIKSMIGKLAIPDRLAARLEEDGFMPLPITAAHAIAMATFPQLSRHDPFDRILPAQAQHEGMALLTADHFLLSLGHDWVVDATH